MATYIKKPAQIIAHQFDSTKPTSSYPDWLQKKFQECELEIVSGHIRYNSILGEYLILNPNSQFQFIVKSEELNDERKLIGKMVKDNIWLRWFVLDGDYLVLDGRTVERYGKSWFELNYEKVGE